MASTQYSHEMWRMKLKLERKIRHMPPMAKLLLGMSMLMSFLLYGSVAYLLLKNDLTDIRFLEIDKCPLCYGTNLCDSLQEGRYIMDGFSHYRIFDAINIKNVFYAKDEKGQPLVFKKLAHYRELDEFTNKMCDYLDISKGCSPKQALEAMQLNEQPDIKMEPLIGATDIMRCPSKRLMKDIKKTFTSKHSDHSYTPEEILQLVTIIIINPEPLIIRLFPASEGWPFPAYLGACGRMVAVEYKGETLAQHYHDPWGQRVDYAYQIFEMADRFTHGARGYSLYMVDLGYDNIAVDENMKVSLIDAENIVIVDKKIIEKEQAVGWNTPYHLDFDDCDSGYGTCLGYRRKLLCGSYETDFNYYTACRNLISSYGTDFRKPGGLLHDTPQEVDEKWQLTNLLNDCAKPPTPNWRLKNKDRILELLKSLRDEYNKGK